VLNDDIGEMSDNRAIRYSKTSTGGVALSFRIMLIVTQEDNWP